MASPTIAARTESALTTAGTSFTVNFTQTTDDLVVIWLGLTNISNPTNDESFTHLLGGTSEFHVFYKILTGAEGGNVVFTINSSKATALAYNIQGFDSGQAPENSTLASGTSTGPDPSTVTPTGGAKDYLWLAAFWQAGEEADDDTWCNSAPTSFGNLIQKTTGITGAAGTNHQIASADFASNAASMDPSAFNTDQSLAWLAFTVAVHPAAAAERVPYYRPHTQLLAH